MKLHRPRLNFLLREAALPLILLLASPAAARGIKPTLRAAIIVVPPFVIRQNNSLTGFSIDLWNAVAKRLNMESSYQAVPDTASLLNALRYGKVDVIVAPVTITSARDAEFDFSIPITQAGQQIMVRDTGETVTENPLQEILALLFSKTMLVWLAIALLLILVPAHLVWLLERRRGDGIIANPKYIPGIFEAMYWAASALTALSKRSG